MAETAHADGNRFGHFLRVLAEQNEGQIFLYNFEASLRLGFIEVPVARKFVLECVEALGEPDNSLEALKTCRKIANNYRFHRPCSGNTGTTAALALRATLLTDQLIGWIPEEQLDLMETSDGIAVGKLENRADRDAFFKKLRTANIVNTGAKLGTPVRPVWVTRVEESWDNLVENCERTQIANSIRNFLGLKDCAGQAYFELRTRQPLNEHVEKGTRKVGRPTALDGSAHPRFRQASDSEVDDGWNRAIHLHLAFGQNAEIADGAPELVVDGFDFEELVWFRNLGATDSESPGSDAMHIERLASFGFKDRSTKNPMKIDGLLASIETILYG